VYRVTWTYGRILCGLYYRTTLVGGSVPPDGPLVVITNHSNGLVDGGMLMILTERPLRIIAKSTILGMPFVGSLARWAGVVPVYRRQDGQDTGRNEEAFRAVHDALRSGEAISIFPEGTSTDPQPRLRRFKSGAARMALGAEDHDPRPGVHVLPVGLSYEDRDRFRSRVHIWVGEPRPVAPLLEAYRSDPAGAVERLTADLADWLGEVTLQLEHFEDRALLGRAEALWPGDRRGEAERLLALAGGLAWLREHRPLEARHLVSDLAALDLGPPNDEERAATGARRLLSLLGAATWGAALAACVLPWAPILAVILLISRFARPSADKFVTMIIVVSSVLGPIWFVAAAALAAISGGALAGLAVAAVLVAGVALGPRLWDLEPRARRAWRAAMSPSSIASHRQIADDLRRRLARLERLSRRLNRRADRSGL
jgi:glycerol-3-phosphate O-acyltransferase/dihydroxyacetone phosphate acyltransferase